MSEAPKKKKVVVTSKKKKVENHAHSKNKVAPTTSRSHTKTASAGSKMLFNKENYKWVFIGIGLILLGMILMMGGSMPSPDVWDESLIYSHRRITLAPIVILTGLGMQVYAIFK